MQNCSSDNSSVVGRSRRAHEAHDIFATFLSSNAIHLHFDNIFVLD